MKEKIPRDSYEAAYQKGRELYASDNKGIAAALAELQEKTGINRASASNYIYNLRQMLRGVRYQRAMSAESTDAFLTWICRDYGMDGLKNALLALEGYIDANQSDMRSHTAVLAKHRGYLHSDGNSQSALKDLLDPPPGNTAPDRAERSGFFIKRDPKVRAYVIEMAKGRCEYCECEGFPLPNGTNYLEAHHVIALANDGADTVDNVIVLCANHHREAHFGTGAEALEQKFVQKIAARNRREQPKGC